MVDRQKFEAVSCDLLEWKYSPAVAVNQYGW